MKKLNRQGNKLILRCGGRIVRLDIEDVLYVEYKGRAAYFHTEDRTCKVDYVTMEKVSEIIGNDCFTQCHRSFIVNKDSVVSISRSENYLTVGSSETRVSLGRSYKKKFYAGMGL